MQESPRLPHLRGQDRLIVALDVSTHDEAFRLVDDLPNVSFFKVGLQLFLSGDILGFLGKLRQRRNSGVFVDLKLSGDIGNTITELVKACMELNVRFLTLVKSDPESITVRTIEAARAARGDRSDPRLLMVPLLSSLDDDDLRELGIRDDPDAFIIRNGGRLLDHGCDGLIVSGQAIRNCREKFPAIDIVSPGIRPAGAGADDHKRLTTPREAIRLGADYLVVGRPVTKSSEPRDAAQRIIDEVDRALEDRGTEGGSRQAHGPGATGAHPAAPTST